MVETSQKVWFVSVSLSWVLMGGTPTATNLTEITMAEAIVAKS